MGIQSPEPSFTSGLRSHLSCIRTNGFSTELIFVVNTAIVTMIENSVGASRRDQDQLDQPAAYS